MSLHDVNGKELNYGGADRDRTGDPLLAKQVLSQLSYSPKRNHVMVGLGRLELPTSPLSGVRSNQTELQAQKYRLYSFHFWKRNEDGKPHIITKLKSFLNQRFKKQLLERRWSNRRFPYGYLVTTSPQSLILPWLAASLRLANQLQVKPTPMVWRAVCTRPGNVFTVARWSTITSDSNFMHSSCRVQSELR